MKVILFETVTGLGKIGDIANVAPGYFRNYLKPKKMAVEATSSNIKVFEHRKKHVEKINAQELTQAEELTAKLAEVKLVMKLKAGENDRLFGSVTSADVAEKLKEAGYEIDKKKIHLTEPLKALGEYEIKIKIHPDVDSKVLVVVEKAE